MRDWTEHRCVCDRNVCLTAVRKLLNLFTVSFRKKNDVPTRRASCGADRLFSVHVSLFSLCSSSRVRVGDAGQTLINSD